MLNIELVIIPEEVIYTDSLASYIREVYIVYQQKIKYFLKKNPQILWYFSGSGYKWM